MFGLHQAFLHDRPDTHDVYLFRRLGRVRETLVGCLDIRRSRSHLGVDGGCDIGVRSDDRILGCCFLIVFVNVLGVARNFERGEKSPFSPPTIQVVAINIFDVVRITGVG